MNHEGEFTIGFSGDSLLDSMARVADFADAARHHAAVECEAKPETVVVTGVAPMIQDGEIRVKYKAEIV